MKFPFASAGGLGLALTLCLSLPAHGDHQGPAAGPQLAVAVAASAPAPVIEPPASSAATASSPGQEEFLGCEKYPVNKRFKWSVRGEVGVSELAASLGQISCQPIVLATGIAQRGGKVALEIPDLVTAPEVYRLFYAALEALGLTVDAAGGVLRIVDLGRAKEVAMPALGGEPEPGDRFVVRLYRPAHVAPAEIAELFGKLKSKDGDVSVFGAASLVIIDRATNVRRMEELGRALDVAQAHARIFTLTVHGQSASDLAGALEKLLSSMAHHAAAGDKSAKPTVIDNDVQALVPIEAAHLVAVVGTEAGWQRVLSIAERLDPAGDDFAISQGHVINLANTNAEDLAATLQSIGLGSRSGASTARPPGSPPSGATANALPLSGDVRIAADKNSNALVVFANGADFNMVRDLVNKLDLPRRQVYVEAVVLDLSVDTERTIGLAFHQGASNGSTSGIVANGSSSLNSVSITASTVASALGGGGLVAGLLGPSFSLLGQDIPSFGVVLQALELNKDVNVISRPHLLTMDNVKSSISVGQQIVFQSSSLGAASTATTPALLVSYQRQPVALTLELTPHLNESDAIRLEINGNIEDVADSNATSSPGGPTTNQRKLSTAVVIKDGETVVLGGLQKEEDAETVTKIPFLGDIPLLGRLFQTRSRSRIKQDLLIVLTPYIIRGPEDLRRIQERKEEERRDFLERYSVFADQSKFEAHVDYRRKRGLLAEINLTAQGAAQEAVALRAAERALRPHPIDGVIALQPAP